MAGRSLFNDVSIQSPHDSIFLSASSSSFLGAGSMVSFQDGNGKKRLERSFFRSYDQEENDDEELEEYFRQPEKKRRLTAEQLRFLEKSFEVENKLEPERKIELAKELGLQPRQIAIWFQNRRARWKTKQLEKDYEAMLASYDILKANYDILLKEKDKLKDEIASITEELLHKEKGSGTVKSSLYVDSVLTTPPKESRAKSVCVDEAFKLSADHALKQDELSSAKSYVFDSDSPRYTEGVHSSSLEPGDASYVFEPDQSDSSQDEEDNISKNLLHSDYFFTKMQDVCYSDLTSSSYIGLPVEDQAFNFW